jgi:hypothetical protein
MARRAVFLLLLAAGCGSSSTSDNPAGGTGTGGAAGASNGDASLPSNPDAGDSSTAEAGPKCGAKPDAGSAGRSSEGVLTNFPAFRFTKSGGELDVTSANFDLKKFPDFTSLAVWGDVQNTTPVQQCIPVADLFQMRTGDGGTADGGTADVPIVIEGPAYEFPGSVFTIVCFEPCGTGVFSGVLNTASNDLLDTTTTLAYSFSTVVLSPVNRRHPDDPRIVAASPKQTPAGWTLSGEMKAGSMDINLLVVNVFIRDDKGLLYQQVQARPGSLGTISAGSQFAFETEPNAQQFSDYELFDEFAFGPAP